MLHVARKTLMAVAALAALALGGAAFAAAAGNGSSSGSSSSSAGTSSVQAPPPGGPGGHRGGHVGRNGKAETLLNGDAAAKVTAAAKAKVPGGTIERVETDADHGSPYEAHVRKSDGTQLEVLIDQDFNVTAVNTMGH
jgi:hypothetical protein